MMSMTLMVLMMGMMVMMVMIKMMVKNEDWLEDLALGATSNPSQSKQSFAALVTTSIIQ